MLSTFNRLWRFLPEQDDKWHRGQQGVLCTAINQEADRLPVRRDKAYGPTADDYIPCVLLYSIHVHLLPWYPVAWTCSHHHWTDSAVSFLLHRAHLSEILRRRIPVQKHLQLDRDVLLLHLYRLCWPQDQPSIQASSHNAWTHYRAVYYNNGLFQGALFPSNL